MLFIVAKQINKSQELFSHAGELQVVFLGCTTMYLIIV